MQYCALEEQIEKMNLVKLEYQHSLAMLKKIIQEKNCNDVADDSDVLEEKNEQIEEQKDQEQLQLLPEPVEQLPLIMAEEQVGVDEQDDNADGFEFISPEDEKQLKDLRKQTLQSFANRKKSVKKSTKSSKNSLSVRQLAQLQQESKLSGAQDFTFHWPLELHHFWLSSLFGARKKANGKPGFHYGIDLAAIKGTPIKAAAAGTVIQAKYVPGYGNNILIAHNKHYRTRYAHLQKILVSEGQKVVLGQKIGTVGDSGSVRKSGRDASHLHFEIYYNGIHVNPLRYLFN
ncbi:MAG: M23 family metallopeptidase [Candidatus Chromulinivorax sp.]